MTTRARVALRRRLLAVVSLAAVTVLGLPLVAHAAVSTTPDRTARVNGTVYAIAAANGRTVIAGSFTSVGGRPRAHVAALRPDGTLDTSFTADTDGTVYAVELSADGSTAYLGGRFSTVNGTARANLAAVDVATGAVRQSWVADTTGTTPEVLALSATDQRLYVGGRYGGIDGTARKRITSLTLAGDVDKTFRPEPDPAAVRFIEPAADGATIFVAGAFSTIGGASRPNGAAELDAATGLATGFNPVEATSGIVAMGLSPGGDRVYLGVMDNRVLAYDTATSALQWTIKNGGDTQAIEVTGSTVYLGGHFGQNLTEKVKRQWVQALTRDGRLTAWDPQLSGGSMGVWALESTSTALLVGGEFTHVAGVNNSPRFARFSGTP